MVIKGAVISGEYYDSISLMTLSSLLGKEKGIIETSVVMGTLENRAILQNTGFYLKDFDQTSDADLLVAVKAENEKAAYQLISNMNNYLKELKSADLESSDYTPSNFEDAAKLLPDANLALISVAGKYAADEAKKAIEAGMHVMIFSDNVSLEEEIELKTMAAKRKLMVMGPDCGTAIINGAPLAFANVVSRGNIGVVAASGTGLQEVTTLISNGGAGISQAIGVGGRDIKQEVGGIMMLQGIHALLEDDATKVILLVSKPPHPEVVSKIQKVIKKSDKPIVTIFLGGEGMDGAINAKTLEEAALASIKLSRREKIETTDRQILPMKVKGKYVRGLFSGGTFCLEAQEIFKSKGVSEIYSNIPSNDIEKLSDAFKSQGHTMVDLGDDQFTAGRPHPMIDFTIRNKRFLEEDNDSECAIILFDLVLGYGANMKPLEDLIPTLKEIKHTALVCSVTGTDGDPQKRSQVIKSLQDIGVTVATSNAHACEIVLRSVQ